VNAEMIQITSRARKTTTMIVGSADILVPLGVVRP